MSNMGMGASDSPQEGEEDFVSETSRELEEEAKEEAKGSVKRGMKKAFKSLW